MSDQPTITGRLRPLLISDPLLLAYGAAYKSVTRRLRGLMDRGQPLSPETHRVRHVEGDRWVIIGPDGPRPVRCPYGQPGDGLYLRAAHRVTPEGVRFRAVDALTQARPPYTPSILCRREYSPAHLVVREVSVVPLADLTDEDALREGIWEVPGGGYGLYSSSDFLGSTPREAFARVWNKINAHSPFDRPQFVWRIDAPLTTGGILYPRRSHAAHHA